MATVESPIITLPSDQNLVAKLRLKLAEYEKRKAGKGRDWEFAHPELAHKLYPGYRDACYKIDVLSAVLDSQQSIATHELCLALREKYGSDFNVAQFCNACGVIASYCGCHIAPNDPPRGGTGLSEA